MRKPKPKGVLARMASGGDVDADDQFDLTGNAGSGNTLNLDYGDPDDPDAADDPDYMTGDEADAPASYTSSSAATGSSQSGGGASYPEYPSELMSGRQEAAIKELQRARDNAVKMLTPSSNKSAMWLAAAAGLLGPTKAGGTMESFGSAAGNVAPLVQRNIDQEQEVKKYLADQDLGIASAQYNQAIKPPQIIDVFAPDGGRQKAIVIDGVPHPFGPTYKPGGGKLSASAQLAADLQSPDPTVRSIAQKKANAIGHPLVQMSPTTKIEMNSETEANKLGTKAAYDKLTALDSNIDLVNKIGAFASAANDAPDSAFGPAGEFITRLNAGLKEAGFSVDPKWGSAELANQIGNQLAPSMRAVGSGSSSDRDVAMFKDALPTMLKSKNGVNASMLYWTKLAEFSQKQKDIIQDAINGGDYKLMAPATRDKLKALYDQGIFDDNSRALLGDKQKLQQWAGVFAKTGNAKTDNAAPKTPAPTLEIPKGKRMILETKPDGSVGAKFE